jgi:hypothetical protein
MHAQTWRENTCGCHVAQSLSVDRAARRLAADYRVAANWEKLEIMICILVLMEKLALTGFFHASP